MHSGTRSSYPYILQRGKRPHLGPLLCSTGELPMALVDRAPSTMKSASHRILLFSTNRVITRQINSLDLGPIMECDDEYWLSPDNQASFQQPAELPAKSAFFNALMRLQQIMAYATRTIVSSL